MKSGFLNHFAFAAALACAGYATATENTPLKFAFGDRTPEAGWTQMAATNVYSAKAGFGFEPGLPRQSEATAGAEISGKDFLTSEKPFLFSVKLPEGNYAVTALLNDKSGKSVTTVKAEQRRLMLEKMQFHPGTLATRTFIVNVRTARISDRKMVKLKQRELETETVDWDDKLTLEFDGTRPTLRALVITPTNVPTVYLAGDSTVCDQPAEPWNSWGQMLPRFFRPDVAVANYAESGETIKSSLGAHRFDKIFSRMKKGDYLFVQFGHNDKKDKATNALEVYKANLRKIVARTRELGGTPVLVTSMERKKGVEENTLADYPDTVRAVAKEEKCALIDLNAMSKVFYRALGTDLEKAFQDGTHHNNYGSYELAKCVVAGIQQDKLPLAKSIVADFGDFDPAKPDSVATFEMPASPTVSKEKPLGN
jgi:lysophospholipase L1-like esterase